jgi:hypothetical protein
MEISNYSDNLELDELAQCIWFEDTIPYQDTLCEDANDWPPAAAVSPQAVGRWALSKLPEKLAVDRQTHLKLQEYQEQLDGAAITTKLMHKFAASSGIPFPQVSYWFKRRSLNVTYQPKRQHDIHNIHYMMHYYDHVTPTPTQLDKDHIAAECGMSVAQVHDWFKDVRRRGFPIRSGKTASGSTAAPRKYKRTKFGSKSRKSNAGAKAKKNKISREESDD